MPIPPAIRPCASTALRRLAHPPRRAGPARAAAAILPGGANRCNVGAPRCLSTSSPQPNSSSRADQLKKLGYRNAQPRASDDFVPLPLPFNKSSNAIFIDAQNAYVTDFPLIQKHIESVVLPSLTRPSVKKIYGDAALLKNSSWAQSMEEHALESTDDVKEGNIDSLLVMGVTECLLQRPDVQTYILITGDGDFAPVVTKLRERQKTVIVYSSGRVMSPKLREACHHYFDTRDLVMADPEAREQELEKREEKQKKREARREAKEEEMRVAEETEKAKEAEEEEEGESTFVGTVSEAFGSLFDDKESSPTPPSKKDTAESTPSPVHKKGWRDEWAPGKREPWYITRKKKQRAQWGGGTRPKPTTFASAVKFHSGLIRNPKGLLKQAYRDVRGRSFRNSCFHLEELTDEEDGETWYTATFTDPITKERFWSGLGAAVVEEHDLYNGPHINPPLHLSEVKVAEGKVYYLQKNHAKQAAAARALDCYIFREACDDGESDGGEGETVLRFSLEDPYASFREGVEQMKVVNYDALLSKRQASA
ncbi:hypothetical protein ACHAXT_003193 [Thalassiosira profunda]